MNWLLRRAQHKDAEQLAGLVFAAAENTLSQIFSISSELSALDFLRHSFKQSDGQYGYANHWLITQQNQTVACISAWHSQLPQAFHQATIASITDFYSLADALTVLQKAKVLTHCIPSPQANEWCIGHLAVSESMQGKGLGKALLQHMLKHANKANKTWLSLDVEQTNQQAIDFYQKQGFHLTKVFEQTPTMRQLGIAPHVHMRKKLAD